MVLPQAFHGYAGLRLEGSGRVPADPQELLVLIACAGADAEVDGDEMEAICMDDEELAVTGPPGWTVLAESVAELHSKTEPVQGGLHEMVRLPDLVVQHVQKRIR